MTSLAPKALPIEAVRSTMIAASILALREMSLDAAYFENLPPEHHDTLRTLSVGIWLPVEVALAHYQTYDRMQLETSRIDDVARRVASRVHGTMLRTLGTLVKQTGFLSAGPIAQVVPRVWERSFRGGSVEIEPLAERDIRLRVRGLGALGTSQYFRTAMTCQYQYGIALFSVRAEVKPLPTSSTDSYSARITWV